MCAGGCTPTLETHFGGIVLDEHGTPVAGAKVQLGDSDLSVVTHGDGTFSLPYKGAVGDARPLTLSRAGYARQTRPAWSSKGNTLRFIMRHIEKTQVITLPGTGDAPVTVSLQHADGMQASLTVGPNAMMLPSGASVAGQANVNLTYWSAHDNMSAAPAIFWGKDGNQRVGELQTFGMADIEVEQAGQVLQVAAGQTLSLTLTAIPEERDGLARADVRMPNLYSMNPNTGLWAYEGSVADGRLEYDPNTLVFTAHLPHLSDWNVDGYLDPTVGGCATGRVVDACDPSVPLANQSFTMWLYNVEQVATLPGSTDASGNFCMSVPYKPWRYSADGKAWEPDDVASSPYLIAGNTANDSGTCNPAPAQCNDCSGPKFYDVPPYCSSCKYLPNQSSGGYTDDVLHFPNTCYPEELPIVAIAPCRFCPGTPMPDECIGFFKTPMHPQSGGCDALPVAKIPGPGCVCDGRGNCSRCAGGTLKEGDACQAAASCCGKDLTCTKGVCTSTNANKCSHILQQGEACTGVLEACCGPGLICSDYLCVPPED